jgi:HAMP domain-containing protein
LTQQQARIAELRAQVAANKAETTRIDSANSALREAIVAAEALTAVLTAEQEKYKGTNPATGQTESDLSKAEIEELAAEVERLRALAAQLGAADATP